MRMRRRSGMKTREEDEDEDEDILIHKTNKLKSCGPIGRLGLSVLSLNINYIHLAVNLFKSSHV